jgi:hypothetical protein
VLVRMDPAERHTRRVERNQHHRGEQKNPEKRSTVTLARSDSRTR